ncbi:hypothetical protein ANCCAN_19234 [Ancylostoma caninum]|uniref:Uncharacterized protein n=1 Tax=Ancylostoma caninum TaxID=29170 RepID=A0A368FRY6_ANCCA|nr:hypothetical protein ANCCAN_19234 [Ancylostoma caninum]
MFIYVELHNDRFPALGGGQNAKDERMKFAMDIWTSPQIYYGLKNVSDYDNNRLYTFANMANGKTLRFACGYKSCANNIHISCIYNLMGGYPHSVLYEIGKMCTKNKDCTTYEGSTCDQTSRLCVFKGTPPQPGGGPNTKCPNNKGMGDPARKAILDAHNKRSGNILNQPIYETGDICSGCTAACKESDGLCNLG